MGVMSKTSKGNRLPERPKPPSWEDIEADASAANKDDVAFSVGKSNLPNVSGVVYIIYIYQLFYYLFVLFVTYLMAF